MLQQIRDKFTGGFAIAILAIICVPFVFFGINYDFIGAGFAAKVNGEEIPTFQLDNAYQNQLLQYNELGDLPPEFRLQLKQAVLDNLIRTRLVDMHLKDQGFRVSDQMVTDMIQAAPEFQENGAFSKELYYNFLEQQVIDANRFEEQQRLGLEQSQLQRAIGATAFVTPAEYRRYLNLYGELRRVAVATFDLAQVAETIELSDEDIATFYDERPTEFMTSESVDIEYIEVRRDLLTEQAEVSEEELLALYEDSASRYQQDEQRQARHILITIDGDALAAEEQAAALTARVQAGEPFEDLAKQYSKDGGTAEQGGDLGLILQSQMPGDLGDAIFSMNQGDVVGPVKTPFGFHVIRLDSIQSGGSLPLEQVRAELERELRDNKAGTAFRAAENALSDALFDAVDLQSMAEAAGLPMQSATGYTRAGGEPFGSNQAALDAIYDLRVLNDGEITDIVELDANRSAVIRVTSHNEAARKPIDEVREQIAASVKTDRAQAIIQDRVDQLQSAVAGGEEFATAAAAVEADIAPYTVVDRVNEEMDSRVLEAVFRARKPLQGTPQVGTEMTETGNYAVFSIDAVAPGRPESVPLADRDARKEQLAAQSGAADYTAFVLQLENEAEIVFSEDVLDDEVSFQ